MSVDLQKARDFVYGNGVLWERALFAHLFQGGSAEHLHRCWFAYKNTDGGFGNALEHDVRCPDSHPLALEFLLTVIRFTGVPINSLLDTTASWLEQNRQPDGSLKNPAALLDYPHAPWWNEGGQSAPDSIVANLTALGLATPSLIETTRKWVEENLTLDKIRGNEWLFMAYHANDYFFTVSEFPNLEDFRTAIIENVLKCAATISEDQYYSFFAFAPTPQSPIAQAAPAGMIDKFLDYLQDAQQEDGSWHDQHGLPQWFPYTTIGVLLTLSRYGRITV